MALARMQFPHNTNLYYITQNTPTVKIPLDDISGLMLEVSNGGLITYKLKEYSYYYIRITQQCCKVSRY